MSYAPITKNGVDRAAPLDFPDRKPAEKQANICIEIAPDGIHVRCEYTGALATIPAAIERLRAAGVLELVEQSKPTSVQSGGNTPARRSDAVRYDDDGAPLCGNANCSRYGKPLAPSQHNDGYFCRGKDTVSGNQKGYCKVSV